MNVKKTCRRENVTTYCRENVKMYLWCGCKNVPMYLRQRLNGLHRTWQPATSNPLPLCASLFFPQLSSSNASWVYLLFWPKTARGLSADVSKTTVIGYLGSREGLRSRRAGQNLRPPGSLSTSALTEMRQTRKEGDRRESRRGKRGSPKNTSAMKCAATGVREHSSRVRGKKTHGNWVAPFTGNARDRSDSQWIWLLFFFFAHVTMQIVYH